MARKLAKACDRFGSSMGRLNNLTEMDQAIKMYLVRVRLNSQGYDVGGAYWGSGAPLYWAYGDGERERQEYFVRGKTRDEAKAKVREVFKHATFYR